MKLFGFTLPISRLKLNLLANFAGQGWSAIMGLAFIPIYIRLMGIEAYGLIGFYLTLQGVLQILDFGLSPTMNREMARYSVQPERATEARDFVRTLEVGYWALGVGIGLVIWFIAPFIATHWIKASELPIDIILQALRLMGVLSALQWPLSFYQGGLMGLQRQAAFNTLQIASSTLSNGGVILILWLVSPTIIAFLTWQIMVNALRVSLITVLLWRNLPRGPGQARFRPSLFQNSWRFAAGMSGITVLSLILTQLDKVLLSRLLTLKFFGYYTLAGIIANSLLTLVGPIFNTLFPQFSALVTVGDEAALKRLYHRSAQLLAVLILPAAAILFFFSFDILQIWTSNVETAYNTAPLVSLLVIGTALNGIQNVPYALQLAYGWTKIGLYMNSIALIPLILAISIMTARFGAIGAATVWVTLNVIYMLISIPIMHQRYLKGEARRWYLEDVGLPLAAAVGVVGVGRWFIGPSLPVFWSLISLVLVGLSAVSVAMLAAPHMRAWVLSQWARLKFELHPQ